MKTRTLLAIGALALAVCGSQSACTRKPAADLAAARAVMDEILEAEREQRGSVGTFWRDRQPTLDRGEVLKRLGVDIAKAEAFEFVMQPFEGGTDPRLRVTAQAKDGSVSLECVQNADLGKPECTEKGPS